jgi:hypothetical protein
MIAAAHGVTVSSRRFHWNNADLDPRSQRLAQSSTQRHPTRDVDTISTRVLRQVRYLLKSWISCLSVSFMVPFSFMRDLFAKQVEEANV